MESLGILKIESIHYYVNDLQRSRKFYVDTLDFAEVARSSPELEQSGKQRSITFEAGQCRITCSQPIGEGGRAWRYLRKHPDGVGTLVFAVEDIQRTFKLLEERGATPISDIQTFYENDGVISFFSITTPFGDTTFRFVERQNYTGYYPGMLSLPATAASNRYQFSHIDHVTSNFQTMMPALLWLEHVMGFERYWEVQFHTDDVQQQQAHGSGLKSQVMWDKTSGVRFANNEPLRPHFKDSQINIFNEDHRGDGVQHVALVVPDIISTVRGLRANHVQFMPTPPSYYDMLPERLIQTGIGQIDEDIQTLANLQILVDGDHHHAYMLQIFLKESSGLYQDPSAGPFFYEIIQRKGDNGFGAGNFRALFESIEREQTKARGVAS